MVKIIAFDYGTKRIGVAVSDPEGKFALALKPIEIAAAEEAVDAIADRIDEERPDTVVVGLPIRLDGIEGDAARRVRSVVEELVLRVEVPIRMVDERLTSAEARTQLRGMRLSRKRKKVAVNTVAAQIILQTYLDSDRGGAP